MEKHFTLLCLGLSFTCTYEPNGGAAPTLSRLWGLLYDEPPSASTLACIWSLCYGQIMKSEDSGCLDGSCLQVSRKREMRCWPVSWTKNPQGRRLPLLSLDWVSAGRALPGPAFGACNGGGANRFTISMREQK